MGEIEIDVWAVWVYEWINTMSIANFGEKVRGLFAFRFTHKPTTPQRHRLRQSHPLRSHH